MLAMKQNLMVVQPVTMLIQRRREQNAGTGIFYHTDLRREVFTPINEEDYFNPRLNSGASGLSSKVGGRFTQIPEGAKREHLYAILGTVVETPSITITTVEGRQFTIDPTEFMLPMNMEITHSDLMQLQEQNQMALLLTCNGYIQLNTQDYGEGQDEDGRDRNLLQGSLWCTPHYYYVETMRPELRTAAATEEEVKEILAKAKEKNLQRALSAKVQSYAQRAERDERRALGKMPERKGTNMAMQVYGPAHFGKANEGNPPYGERK